MYNYAPIYVYISTKHPTFTKAYNIVSTNEPASACRTSVNDAVKGVKVNGIDVEKR